MGILKIFSRGPAGPERKGDALFEAGEYGLAKMRYEEALDRLSAGGIREGNEEKEAQLGEKLRASKEALAQRHRKEGLEIMNSEYYEAAEESFRLALELTEDPALIQEVEGLLEKLPRTSAGEEAETAGPDPGRHGLDSGSEGSDMEGEEETFAALIGSMPEPVRRAYQGYGEAFKKGYLALNRGDFDLAVEELSRAMEECDPETGYVSLELATAYMNLEMAEKAEPLAQAFLEKHPRSFRGREILCEILWETGDTDRALALLNDCPEETAQTVPILALRGETLFRAGRLREAEELYSSAIKTWGRQEVLTRALARIWDHQGKKEKARDLYGEVLAGCTTCGARGDPFVKERFADLSLELGDRSSRLLELYLSLVHEDPGGKAEYYRKISRIYEHQGYQEEAIRYRELARRAGAEAGETPGDDEGKELSP